MSEPKKELLRAPRPKVRFDLSIKENRLFSPAAARASSSWPQDEHQKNYPTAFLLVLETVATETASKTFFKTRYTVLIPDMFFVFSFVLLTVTSAWVDRAFVYLTMLKHDYTVWGASYLTSLVLSQLSAIIFEAFRTQFRLKRGRAGVWMPKDGTGYLLHLTLSVLGLDSILLGSRVLDNAIATPGEKPGIAPNAFVIFQSSNCHLSTIKSYCLVTCFKCLPQIYIAFYFLHVVDAEPVLFAASKISILVNLVFFSWATAISLPLRTYPQVLKTTLVLPLMGLSKFMGILSLTVAHLLLVKACFKSLGYHSLLFHLMQFILAFVVAAQITNSLCRHANFAQVFIYNSGLALIYTILFVHPVQDCGKLWYFMYYLMKCLTEMCFMYMVGLDGHYLLLMTYYCLYIFGVGLLTLSFGLASLFKSVSSSLPTES